MVTLQQSPVHSDPSVLGGTLVFRHTRVPAQSLLDHLDDGYSLEQFLDYFPSVERLDAQEFLSSRGKMRIILDENIPQPLAEWLTPQEVTSVQSAGWGGIGNGDLIQKINGVFDLSLPRTRTFAISKT